MKHIKLFEAYNKEDIILTSIQNRTITFSIIAGKMKDIDNKAGIRFPFHDGESFNMTVKSWAKNNNFKWNGKSLKDDEKVFGINKKHIPPGHELRRLFPNKFK